MSSDSGSVASGLDSGSDAGPGLMLTGKKFVGTTFFSNTTTSFGVASNRDGSQACPLPMRCPQCRRGCKASVVAIRTSDSSTSSMTSTGTMRPAMTWLEDFLKTH